MLYPLSGRSGAAISLHATTWEGIQMIKASSTALLLFMTASGLSACGPLTDPRVFGSSFDDNVYSRAEREEIDRREGRERRPPPHPIAIDENRTGGGD